MRNMDLNARVICELCYDKEVHRCGADDNGTKIYNRLDMRKTPNQMPEHKRIVFPVPSRLPVRASVLFETAIAFGRDNTAGKNTRLTNRRQVRFG